jgi:hypothetical protein
MKENKLIAEFMGTEWHKDFFKDICIISSSNILYKFHTSWDWLMPVVEKIYQLGLDNESALLVRDAVAEANIEETYRAVVEFIKEYNLNT